MNVHGVRAMKLARAAIHRTSDCSCTFGPCGCFDKDVDIVASAIESYADEQLELAAKSLEENEHNGLWKFGAAAGIRSLLSTSPTQKILDDGN